MFVCEGCILKRPPLLCNKTPPKWSVWRHRDALSPGQTQSTVTLESSGAATISAPRIATPKCMTAHTTTRLPDASYWKKRTRW